MRRFYKPSLWIPQHFLVTNPNLHHGLLVIFRYKDKKTGKWRPNSFRPRVKLIPKDSKAAFICLAGGDSNQPYRAGRFLDLKTLAWALRNRSFSLDSACGEFKVPGKLDHKPSGSVTPEEAQYCRQDVAASVGLLEALLGEFRKYPLGMDNTQLLEESNKVENFHNATRSSCVLINRWSEVRTPGPYSSCPSIHIEYIS